MLPFRLRREAVLAFLYATLSPLETLHGIFIRSRRQNLYRLLITPQVCYLEKMLNDRYDATLRRIYISDFFRLPDVNIFLEDELKPLYIFQDYEAMPVYLGTIAEREAVETDFVVNVPYTVPYNENEMRALLDSYKLAGKRYEIVTTL